MTIQPEAIRFGPAAQPYARRANLRMALVLNLGFARVVVPSPASGAARSKPGGEPV